MDWLQVVTIIVSIAGTTYWFRTGLKEDICRLESDIHNLTNKVDADTRAQTARTDRLYEMFVEMQARMDNRFKEMDNRFKEADRKFYDLLNYKTRTEP